jgi:cell fate regulator YaaT (PSP1 superfamily)
MKYSVLARFGAMRGIGVFSSNIKNLRLGDKVILRSSRGTEWGEILSGRRDNDTGRRVKLEGSIIRRVTPADHEQRQSIEENDQPRESAYCAAKIKEHQLQMRLASAEHIFGGEKIIFYFLAEGRVDFRELVKDLATEYRTRIEMRQIGVRDEARLLAEYEHCGRELCCRTFIKDLEPVTMRMAKHQKTTLDPAKISGRCGRLMCCLRYEDDTYAELKKNLPKKGTRVKSPEAEGEVVSSEILAQTVTIETADRRYVKVSLDDITEALPKDEPRRRREPDGPRDKPREKRSESDGDRSDRPGRRPRGRRRPRDEEDAPADARQSQERPREQAQERPKEQPRQRQEQPPQQEEEKQAPRQAQDRPEGPPAEGNAEGEGRSRSRRSRRSRGRRRRGDRGQEGERPQNADGAPGQQRPQKPEQRNEKPSDQRPADQPTPDKPNADRAPEQQRPQKSERREEKPSDQRPTDQPAPDKPEQGGEKQGSDDFVPDEWWEDHQE